MSNKLVLTAEQIKALAEFAAKENQPSMVRELWSIAV